jgi:hypothetical protein
MRQSLLGKLRMTLAGPECVKTQSAGDVKIIRHHQKLLEQRSAYE